MSPTDWPREVGGEQLPDLEERRSVKSKKKEVKRKEKKNKKVNFEEEEQEEEEQGGWGGDKIKSMLRSNMLNLTSLETMEAIKPTISCRLPVR